MNDTNEPQDGKPVGQQETTKKPAASEQGGWLSGLWETVRTVIYAVLIALVVRTFLYEPFNIPSGSMKPTLLVGDYLFVSKYAYGYSRYAFPLGLAPFSGRIMGTEPERGDVVVFKLPRDNETDYIKRVIGLPGDRIQVIDGLLHINGEAVKRETVGEVLMKNDLGFPERSVEYIETLPNGRQHAIWEFSDDSRYDNTPVYTVPEDHFFAMGDNRDKSLDSRATSHVGFVPFENLVGRAGIIFFSHKEDSSLFEVWKWPTSIRFSRLFDDIV